MAISLFTSGIGPLALRAAPVENKLVLSARKVTLPFYHGPENKLSLLVKADHFTRENQRRGFFRIGVLPLLVVHDVSLEVRQPQYFGAVAHEFHQHLAGKDLKKTVELRDFALTVPTNGISLTATKVRLVSQEQWELSGTVRLIHAAGTNDYTKVSLVISGNETGTLRASDGNSHFLFKKKSDTP